jgi:hypothetical protein
MATLLTDRRLSAELSQWGAARIPHVGAAGFGPNWTIGVALHGKLAAVVVWHDFQPQHGTIQLSSTWQSVSREKRHSDTITGAEGTRS